MGGSLRRDVAIAHDGQIVTRGGGAADLTRLIHGGGITLVGRLAAGSGILGVPDGFDVDVVVVTGPRGREDLAFEFQDPLAAVVVVEGGRERG